MLGHEDTAEVECALSRDMAYAPTLKSGTEASLKAIEIEHDVSSECHNSTMSLNLMASS